MAHRWSHVTVSGQLYLHGIEPIQVRMQLDRDRQAPDWIVISCEMGQSGGHFWFPIMIDSAGLKQALAWLTEQQQQEGGAGFAPPASPGADEPTTSEI